MARGKKKTSSFSGGTNNNKNDPMENPGTTTTTTKTKIVQRMEWPADQTWSSSKKKRMRKLFAKQQQQQGDDGDNKQHETESTTKKTKKTKKRNNDNDVVSSPSSKKIKRENKNNDTSSSSPSSEAAASSSKNVKTENENSSTPKPSSIKSDSNQKPKNQPDNTVVGSSGTKKSSKLLDKFKDRLLGSRFRILNEELYTTTSQTAFERFQKNPSLFDEYHTGFRYQVQDWPINPITVIVRRILQQSKHKINKSNNKKKSSSNSNNHDTPKQLTVADFGCGEAELAKELLNHKIPTNQSNNDGNNSRTYCPFIVHSFDLVAPNEYVTACDMANVPIESNTVDIGVFCLSLMGTNIHDFINEAHRVLKPNATLLIAEVRSRFINDDNNNNEKSTKDKVGDAEKTKDDLGGFLTVLDKLGFACNKIDKSNQLFMMLELQKKNRTSKDTKEDEIDRSSIQYTAKPCIYKRR